MIAALALGGCGRRGPHELPPDAQQAAKPTQPQSAVNRLAPNGGKPAETPAVAPPKTPFFLDPLL